VKEDKVSYWLDNGAGVTEAARALLLKKGLLKSQPTAN
jgi:ribosomal protein S16